MLTGLNYYLHMCMGIVGCTEFMVWVEVSKNAELFSEELSTRNVVSSSYTWYVVLCMYVCLFVVAAPWCGWLAWSIYIVYLSCRTYTAVNQIVCGLWGETTCSLSSIGKGLYSY